MQCSALHVTAHVPGSDLEMQLERTLSQSGAPHVAKCFLMAQSVSSWRPATHSPCRPDRPPLTGGVAAHRRQAVGARGAGVLGGAQRALDAPELVQVAGQAFGAPARSRAAQRATSRAAPDVAVPCHVLRALGALQPWRCSGRVHAAGRAELVHKRGHKVRVRLPVLCRATTPGARPWELRCARQGRRRPRSAARNAHSLLRQLVGPLDARGAACGVRRQGLGAAPAVRGREAGLATAGGPCGRAATKPLTPSRTRSCQRCTLATWPPTWLCSVLFHGTTTSILLVWAHGRAQPHLPGTNLCCQRPYSARGGCRSPGPSACVHAVQVPYSAALCTRTHVLHADSNAPLRPRATGHNRGGSARRWFWAGSSGVWRYGGVRPLPRCPPCVVAATAWRA